MIEADKGCLCNTATSPSTERDGGIKSNPEHIFLTAGASDAVKMVLNMLISSDKTGVRPGAAPARNAPNRC